jgi:hypothetical protein
MRKFTLYQASRFTKISRYKLEQAIEEGLLTCTDGKGNVKCFILEDELKKFIEEHGEQFRRFEYPDEEKGRSHIDDSQFISRDTHDQFIREKNRVIELLESQLENMMTLLKGSTAENKDTIRVG